MTADRAAGTPARPPARHDPDALAKGPTLPKPLALVRATDPTGRLRLSDRKLVNVLLAFAWNDVAKGDGPHRVAACRVREALGQRAQHKNTELRHSLQRLEATPVVLTVGGQRTEVPLLTDVDLPQGAVRLGWTFHAAVLAAAREPRPWSEIRLDVCARFRHKAALILYEVLAAYVRREKSWLRLELAELRALLSLPEDVYDGDWTGLRRRAVEPAIAAINEHAPFRVTMRVEKARGTRRVEAVRFDCRPRDTR